MLHKFILARKNSWVGCSSAELHANKLAVWHYLFIANPSLSANFQAISEFIDCLEGQGLEG